MTRDKFQTKTNIFSFVFICAEYRLFAATSRLRVIYQSGSVPSHKNRHNISRWGSVWSRLVLNESWSMHSAFSLKKPSHYRRPSSPFSPSSRFMEPRWQLSRYETLFNSLSPAGCARGNHSHSGFRFIWYGTTRAPAPLVLFRDNSTIA